LLALAKWSQALAKWSQALAKCELLGRKLFILLAGHPGKVLLAAG
jgi:hypothetical protein